ncbi:hypothetical protein TRAPUB_1537 [Trametes pubescens]|uniref:MYND-type domain-containing protein n=1 Tax=Trametes pubescens TaxID=154538 RepID=A0A1M2VJ46_TRAPU|nr:hypothetical protein TRAPUB_1537 [Trametes pubescens]
MQSSQSRYRNPQPTSRADIFEATAGAGIASIRRTLNKQKEEKRMAKTHCTFCGKDDNDGPLKSCSRCKAAHYCDHTCQLSDFKARHKRQCANFVHPPTTSAFLTKPRASERYPLHPLFAHWHEDGVGCWVTIEGRIDCELQSLAESLDPTELRDRQKRMMAGGGAASRQTIRTHKVTARSLLGLRVLVQNRRKEKNPILVFGSHAQVLSQPMQTSAVQRGTAEGDNLVKFMRDGVPSAAIGVANDPWDKVHRLGISYINGVEVKKDAPLPDNIKNANEATILLNTGEYAILHLQFRVGDGNTISKDWEALGALEAFFLPWAPWDGTSAPAALAGSFPTAQAPASDASSTTHGRLLRAPFDQPGVDEYFADFIEHGEEAYTRSHYGDARANMSRVADESMAVMGERLLAQVAQAGNTDVLIQRLRDSGMGELADKLASRQ